MNMVIKKPKPYWSLITKIYLIFEYYYVRKHLENKIKMRLAIVSKKDARSIFCMKATNFCVLVANSLVCKARGQRVLHSR